MPKKCLLLVCALLLGGCALPLPVQIASWAIDGLLVITTEKTMTDHGVSLVARKDCALWRGVTEGAVCRDGDAVTAVAFADLAPPAQAGGALTFVGDEEAARLASFETAAGGDQEPVQRQPVVTVAEPNEGAITVSASWQAIVEAAMFIEQAPQPVAPEAMCDAPTAILVAEEPETRPAGESLAHESTPTPSLETVVAIATPDAAVELAMLFEQAMEPVAPEAMCDAPPAILVAEEPETRPAQESLAHESTPTPSLETVVAIATPDAAVELAMLFEQATEPVAPEAMCDAPAVSRVAVEPEARPEAEKLAHESAPAPPVEAVVEIETLEPAIELAAAPMPRPAEALSAPAPDDVYYVVGTFMEWPKALAFAERHVQLEPTMLSARRDGRRLYRIAVGPVEPLAHIVTQQRLRAQGLVDAWAARMTPETWSIVAATGPPDRHRAQVAEVWPPPLAER